MDGVILTGSELKKALRQGRLFAPDSITWDHVRPGGYYLTVASDMLYLPASPPARPDATTYWPGNTAPPSIELKPGETAFVSTKERVQFDWAMGGILGPAWSPTQRGLVILTGLTVDPGYGRIKCPDGTWVPATPEERLYFVIANMGTNSFHLHPGTEPIARLVVHTMEEVPEDERLRFPQAYPAKTWDPNASEPGITHFADIGGSAETVRAELLQECAKVADANLNTREYVNTTLEHLNTRMDFADSGAKSVALFGIYLVAATLFGVALAVAVSGINALATGSTPTWLMACLVVLLASFLIAQCTLGILIFHRWSSMTFRSQEESRDPSER